MGRPKGYVFAASYAVTCPLCGETKKTKSGLRAHALSEHGLRIDSVDEWLSGQGGVSEPLDDQPTPITTSPSNKALREELEARRLRGELAKLGVTPQPHQASVTEKLGLGAETDRFSVESQLALLKSLGIGERKESESDQLMKKLTDQIVIDRLTGKNQGNSGWLDTIKAIIAILGISGPDIGKFIFQRNQPAPTNPNAFKVGDLEIPAGSVQMDSNFMQFLISREDAKIAFEASKARDLMFLEGAKSIARVGEKAGIIDDIKDKFSGIGSKPREPEEHMLEATCSECDEPHTIRFRGGQPGDKIPFVCKSCGSENEIELTIPEREPKPIRQPKVKERGREFMRCNECGQLIDITGHATGEEIEYPSCEEVQMITSPDEPLPAKQPQKRGGETLFERNRRQ